LIKFVGSARSVSLNTSSVFNVVVVRLEYYQFVKYQAKKSPFYRKEQTLISMSNTPFQLYDNHARKINYLRLAVTDRCNLRCFYCMPAEGMQFLPRKEILSYEEMYLLVKVFAQMGIDKVRLTGGEPFLRRDLMVLIRQISSLEKIKSLHITTNGLLTAPYIPELKKLNVSINLSLDTLDKERFTKITRRDNLAKVLKTLDLLVEHKIPTKINAVVMQGINTQDIIPLAQLAKEMPIDVRFIEEMPFNGVGERNVKQTWNYVQIIETLKAQFPELEKIPVDSGSTSLRYTLANFKGKIGIIPAYSRNFCGACNRIRITAQGTLKTCLYDKGVLDFRSILREDTDENSKAQKLKAVLAKAINKRHIDGFEAEKAQENTSWESMSAIGG
jgi:cyclic pyranopterin phosphate synthase